MVRIRIVGTEIGIWSQKGPIVEFENSMMLIVICSLAGCGGKKKAKGGKKNTYPTSACRIQPRRLFRMVPSKYLAGVCIVCFCYRRIDQLTSQNESIYILTGVLVY